MATIGLILVFIELIHQLDRFGQARHQRTKSLAVNLDLTSLFLHELDLIAVFGRAKLAAAPFG